MYRDGRGAQQDNVRADMWYHFAAQQALRQGETSVKYSQRLDAIAKQLIPAHLAEARRLSQQCPTRQSRAAEKEFTPLSLYLSLYDAISRTRPDSFRLPVWSDP
jgi:hypothetical protein